MSDALPFTPDTTAPDLPGVRYYEIPAGTDAAKCRGCHAVIYWIKTPKGKNMPVDRDGRSHFETCPDANRFSRRSK